MRDVGRRKRTFRKQGNIILKCIVCVITFSTFGSNNDPGLSQSQVGIPTLTGQQDLEAKSFLSTLPRNVIMIEPYHGLGNRLRAYASAAALARKTGKALVVVWIPDPHVNATMRDLFDTTNITIVDYSITRAVSLVFPDLLTYDYNSKGRKDEVLRDSFAVPIYVRSAYVLQSETFVSENEISEELRMLNPSQQVVEHVHNLEAKIATLQGDLIGVHIRMNSDITRDVPGIQDIDKHNPASAAHMGPVISERGRCHYKAFIPHMEKSLEINPNASFLIASDSSCAIVSLHSKFTGKIVSTDMNKLALCEGSITRGKACLQICLAEFLVLGSNVSSLILSEWSSASELILRFNAHEVPHKIGCSPKTHSWFSLHG